MEFFDCNWPAARLLCGCGRDCRPGQRGEYFVLEAKPSRARSWWRASSWREINIRTLLPTAAASLPRARTFHGANSVSWAQLARAVGPLERSANSRAGWSSAGQIYINRASCRGWRIFQGATLWFAQDRKWSRRRRSCSGCGCGWTASTDSAGKRAKAACLPS